MQIERRLLSELKPAGYNPRKTLQPGDHDFEQIVKSIEQFGYIDPIIINNDGTIIGGHQRCNVLIYLGYTEADVVVVDLDKINEKALNIALNKISGEWDEKKLADLLIDLESLGVDVSITGFAKDEISDLISRLNIPLEAHDDNFDIEAALGKIVEPITKIGDIWQLGKHRLMCGDSTNPDDITTLMGGKKADIIITDPPYNVDYEGGTKDKLKILNDNMSPEKFRKLLDDSFRLMAKSAKPGAPVYIFHSDKEEMNFRQAMIDAGIYFAQNLIWEKNHFVLGRQDYQWRHEPILYGWVEGGPHYFINDRTQDTVILEEIPDFENMKKKEIITWIENFFKEYDDQTSVIYNKRPNANKDHPTPKPIELISKFIINSSKPGWIIFDGFGGAGSTLIAAEQLGRRTFINEIAPVLCDVIIRRWENYTGKKAVKINASTTMQS